MLQQVAPWFGYLASLCLVLALLVSHDLKFRWANTFGNIAFIIYGVILSAIPIIITNTILLCINIFYLVKLYRQKEYFDLIEFNGEEKLVNKFLTFHKAEVEQYFPEFEPSAVNGNLNFVVLRDLVIANMFSARLSSNGDAEVLINFTVKKYRDYKVGRFIFEREKQFLVSKGVNRIWYKKVPNKKHEAFLKVMGFTLGNINGAQHYVKQL